MTRYQRSACSVLLTGGAGYIGTQLAWDLIEHDWDVVIIDNLSTGNPQFLPANTKLIVGDIRDTGLVRKVLSTHDIRGVIHLAGSTIVPESVRDPLSYYDNNVSASRDLLECCVAAQIEAIVFSSTAAVYGEVQKVPLDEDTPVVPINPYGRSKLMIEDMLRDVDTAYDVPHVCLRYFNVAGSDPAGRCGLSQVNATHLIKVACEAAVGKRDGLSIFGTDFPTRDGTGVRDYIHVADLASAHRHALDYLFSGGMSSVLNCGYGEGYSVQEVVYTVQKVSGVRFPVRIAPRRPGDPAEVVCNPSSLKEKLAWSPKFNSLEKIVEHALAWEVSGLQATRNQKAKA